MPEKTKETSLIIKQDMIATDVYSLWLSSENLTKYAKPGQFVSVYCADGSRILPRPISICEIDRTNQAIRLVYRIAGKGTEEFSQRKAGESLTILGPLGNGFPMEQAKGKNVFLIGGGIGIPPMLETAKQLDADKTIIAGYKDELFLQKELSRYGSLYVATEDGSAGTKGNVLDAVTENHLAADLIFACGPAPMLRAIKTYALDRKIPCWISMEEKMACGIGACLACVCQSKEVDSHSHVHNKRICAEGPVFLSTEVEV